MNNFYLEQVNKHGYWWSGNYKNWELAELECIGYSENNILEKVKNTILFTKDKDDVYERDGCIISGEPTYAFELLEFIKKISYDNKINLIDFGGSLGTTYFQLKKYLKNYDITWNIVEQEHFVTCGKEILENKNLKFYKKIDECLLESKPNFLISSSTLPYIKNYYEVIKEICSHNFEWIILDRISTIDGDKNRLSIQIVPPDIYEAIYPCWFFGNEWLINFFKENGYSIEKTFLSLGGDNFSPNIETSSYKGFVFKKI